jgi:hypothetical protein
MNKDKTKRPIRYCPGHDLLLDVIQFVVEQLLPIVSDDDETSNPQMTSNKN